MDNNRLIQPVKYEEIISAFRRIGLGSGDIVLVHSSLSKVGQIEGISLKDRNAFLECIYNAFKDVINIPEGTLVVPTFTHEYARNGVQFIYEETPSEVGAFTEYIRRLGESLRSIHPINSFTAVGALKHDICGGMNRNCYGYDSVFDRLIKVNAKMLFFGAGMRHMTMKHHMEHVMGLPYTYHKAYFTPAFKEGKPLPLPFMACVRYLKGKVENNDCSVFRKHLASKGLLHSDKIGSAELLLVSIRDAFEEACMLLRDDPCYFLETPYYETN